MFIFAIGIACVSTLLGFLVGASESPVAGIALTATFGIVATGLALHQNAAGVPKDSLPPVDGVTTDESKFIRALRSLGYVLVIFSIAFSTGLWAGIHMKMQSHKVQIEASLPWAGQEAPKSARKAIDWVVVRHKLRDIGYTDSQIVEIYKIDTKKGDSNDGLRFWGSEEQLLSSILTGVQTPSSEKIIARGSVPDSAPGRPINKSGY